ncbi:MAG TPA: SGNH/GDSL hydrolase family protein [Acidimicrobiales bacterium]|nr:SGNH/GDSL hydrolase family protein [Acidimicrobiales bacterium]
MDRPTARVVVALVAFLAVAGLFLAVRRGPLLLGVIAAFLVGTFAVRLHRAARREALAHDGTGWERWRFVAIVGGSGVALVLVWWLGPDVDGLGFFGLALVYVGVGLGLDRLRAAPDPPEQTWLLVLGAAVGVAVVCVVGAALGAVWLVVPGAVAAVVGVPLGLSLVSELATRELEGREPRLAPAVAVVGAVVLIGALVIVWLAGVGAVVVAALAVVALAVGAGVVTRSTLDVVVVVVGAALVLTLTQRSAPEPAVVQPAPGDRVVAAIGDSYMSGEGAEVFFAGTNRAGVDECRRAPTAYPVLFARLRAAGAPDRVAFLACSGAVASDVLEDQATGLAGWVADDDLDVALVLVSAGGNDAGFGAIGRACLAPADCSRLEAAYLDHLAAVGAELDRAYRRAREILGDVAIAVVPYPVPLAPASCPGSTLGDAEHRFLHDFTVALNDTIAASAATAGFAVVDTMPTALADTELRICDGEPAAVGVNFLAANTVVGTLEQSANPLAWWHNSLHPNARGHEAMHDALVAWWESDPDLRPDPVAAAADIDAGATAGAPCVGADDLARCASDWAVRETARFLLRVGVLVVAVVGGAWAVALGVAVTWRRWLVEPAP